MEGLEGLEHAIGHREVPEKIKGKGYKACKECGIKLPASSKKCDCGYIFFINKQPPRPKSYVEVEDWTTLEKGQDIYLLNTDRWESPEGEIVPMGENGEFQVVRVQTDGLLLYNNGYHFQSMVNAGYNAKTGITRGVTKIFTKKKKVR